MSSKKCGNFDNCSVVVERLPELMHRPNYKDNSNLEVGTKNF